MANGNVTGSGTSNSPYIIEDAQDYLYARENLANTSHWFQQTGDIDFEGAEISSNFEVARWDGGNNTISNFQINSTSNDVGLFTIYANPSSSYGIRNLFIKNASVITTGNTVGVVTGYLNDTNIYNVYVFDSYVEGYSQVGGIVGREYRSTTSNETRLRDSYFSGIVVGNDYVGGILGHIRGPNSSNPIKLINCVSKAEVRGYSQVGGVIGGKEGGYVLPTENCAYVGDKIVRLGGTSNSFGKINGTGDTGVTNCISLDDVIFESY